MIVCQWKHENGRLYSFIRYMENYRKMCRVTWATFG